MGCTLAELGDRMSSEEYAIRRHLYYRKPGGLRQVATLLAQLLEMYYAVHKAQDAPAKRAAEWLNPTRAKAEAPTAKTATFSDLQDFLNGL